MLFKELVVLLLITILNLSFCFAPNKFIQPHLLSKVRVVHSKHHAHIREVDMQSYDSKTPGDAFFEDLYHDGDDLVNSNSNSKSHANGIGGVDYGDGNESSDDNCLGPSTSSRGGNDYEWMFFDVAKINVQGGEGGDGCMAMRVSSS
jgi:hypothetical protein